MNNNKPIKSIEDLIKEMQKTQPKPREVQPKPTPASSKKSIEDLIKEMQETQPKPREVQPKPTPTSNTRKQIKSIEDLIKEMQETQPKPKEVQPKPTPTSNTRKQIKSIEDLIKEMQETQPKPREVQSKPTSTSSNPKPREVEKTKSNLPPKQQKSIKKTYETAECSDSLNDKLSKIDAKITNLWKNKKAYKILAGLGVLSYFTGYFIGRFVFDGPELKENQYSIPTNDDEIGVNQEQDENIIETAKITQENNSGKDYKIDEQDEKIIEVAELEDDITTKEITSENDYSYAYDVANNIMEEKYGINIYYDESYDDTNTTSRYR